MVSCSWKGQRRVETFIYKFAELANYQNRGDYPMAEESKGIALVILGIVAVIAVVGLVLLFTGTTGKVSAPYQKLYGGVNYGEDAYLVSRSRGGYTSTPGVPPAPDAGYYPAGFYTEDPGVGLMEDAPFYGERAVGTDSYTTFGRQPYYVPSGQLCAAGDAAPGFRCPYGTTCIADPVEAESGNWIPAPEYPCFVRASSAR